MLARTGYATGPIQAALAAAGIPHRVLGSLGLYERAEVRDALAYLALLANPRDAQAFRRAVQAPRRGVGTASAEQRRRRRARALDGDLITASARAHELTGDPLAARARPARPVRRRARRASARDRARALARRTSSSPRSRSTAALVACHQARRDRSPDPSSAATPNACSRTCARCAAPPRPTTTSIGDRRLAHRLPRARRRPARRRRSGPARTAASPSRRSTAPRAPRRGSSLLLGCEEQLLPSWRALQSRRPRGPRRGAAAVLRRRHPRQGPPRPHPRRTPRRTPHRRPLALPHRSRPARAARGARRLNPPLPPKEHP